MRLLCSSHDLGFSSNSTSKYRGKIKGFIPLAVELLQRRNPNRAGLEWQPQSGEPVMDGYPLNSTPLTKSVQIALELRPSNISKRFLFETQQLFTSLLQLGA